METVSATCGQISNQRRVNVRYELADMLCSAFAMFSLKSPSLLAFRQQLPAEKANLQTIYRIGATPGDTQMRAALDPLDPAPLRALFARLFEHLRLAGAVTAYQYWRDHVIVAVDGVEYFSSTKTHCDHCTTRTELVERYPTLKMVLVEDALYANAPHIRQITGYGWCFVLNVKPDSHPSLEKQFAGCRATWQVKELRFRDAQGFQHAFAWTIRLYLCKSAPDVPVNYLFYEQTDPRGKLTRWTWVTNLPLTARTVERVMHAGRSRWKIENETFNTRKNQGSHFEHNYGHGTQNLATTLVLLMLLAFTVDQILQGCWQLFRQIRTSLRTKAKLGENLRGLFQVLVFPSMTDLYHHLALLYGIQIE